MNPYAFVIHSVPMRENQNFETVAGAKVHIWVMDNDIESAKQRALKYIKSYLWNPIEVEYEFEISREQIPDLHPDEARLYCEAFQYDIAADFVGWPITPGNPDDPVIKGTP